MALDLSCANPGEKVCRRHTSRERVGVRRERALHPAAFHPDPHLVRRYRTRHVILHFPGVGHLNAVCDPGDGK